MWKNWLVDMRHGDITSSPGTVGVAVVNCKMSRLRTKAEVIADAERGADMVVGVKRVLPGMDPIGLPGALHPGVRVRRGRDVCGGVQRSGRRGRHLWRSLPCRQNVRSVFTDGEQRENHPGTPPYNTLMLMTDHSEVVQKYRKVMRWTPIEPRYPGSNIDVALRPKDIKISLVVCDDGNYPEIWCDWVMKGAEFVVRSQGDMYAAAEGTVLIAKAVAWANNTYVAVANAVGFDGLSGYFDHSWIIGFEGRTLGETGAEPYGIQCAQLSISAIRGARRTRQAQNHLFKLLHHGYTRVLAAGDRDNKGVADCPFDFYKLWARDAQKAQKNVESFTRETIGVAECLVGQLPLEKVRGGVSQIILFSRISAPAVSMGDAPLARYVRGRPAAVARALEVGASGLTAPTRPLSAVVLTGRTGGSIDEMVEFQPLSRNAAAETVDIEIDRICEVPRTTRCASDSQ